MDANELEPHYVIDVTVPLDGDDDPRLSRENVTRLLKTALAAMQDAGAIRGYTLEVRS